MKQETFNRALILILMYALRFFVTWKLSIFNNDETLTRSMRQSLEDQFDEMDNEVARLLM